MINKITINLSLNQVRYIITALKHVAEQYQKEINCTGSDWAYEGKQTINDLIEELKEAADL